MQTFDLKRSSKTSTNTLYSFITFYWVVKEPHEQTEVSLCPLSKQPKTDVENKKMCEGKI